MRVDKQKNILCVCMDTIALARFMQNAKDRRELAEMLISEMDSYPFVSAKMSSKVVFAYVMVMNARNVLRRAIIEQVSYRMAFALAATNIENAYEVLADK